MFLLRIRTVLRRGANRRWLIPLRLHAGFLESALSKHSSLDADRSRCGTAFGLWIVEACKMGFVPAYDCVHCRTQHLCSKVPSGIIQASAGVYFARNHALLLLETRTRFPMIQFVIP